MDTSIVQSVIQSVTSLTADAIGIIAVILILSFWSLKSGKRHLVAVIFGLYVALLLTMTFPYFDTVRAGAAETSPALLSGAVFIVFALLGYFIAKNSTIGDYPASGATRWFQALFLSAAAAVLLLVAAFHATTVAAMIEFHPTIASTFSNPQLLFWWLIAPLVVLFFATRRSF